MLDWKAGVEDEVDIEGGPAEVGDEVGILVVASTIGSRTFGRRLSARPETIQRKKITENTSTETPGSPETGEISVDEKKIVIELSKHKHHALNK